MDDAHSVRYCVICGIAIGHRHPRYITCSTACSQENHRAYSQHYHFAHRDEVLARLRTYAKRPEVRARDAQRNKTDARRAQRNAAYAHKVQDDGFRAIKNCKAREAYAKHGGHTAARRDQMRAWKQANADRLRAEWRERYATDMAFRERMLDKYRQRYAEKDRGYRKHIPLLFARDGFLCRLCLTPFANPHDGTAVHVDHIIPVSRGGGNEVDNLQLLCRACNLSKGARVC